MNENENISLKSRERDLAEGTNNVKVHPKVIALWMSEEVRSEPLLQWDAAARIYDQFGTDYLGETEKGNWSISVEVRKLFTEMNPDVIWDRRIHGWRQKNHWDE